MLNASRVVVVATVVVGMVSIPAAASDWLNWRGPERTGTSPEKNLPVRWSAAENLAWTLPLPSGSGAQ